jgi:hypothetical protein
MTLNTGQSQYIGTWESFLFFFIFEGLSERVYDESLFVSECTTVKSEKQNWLQYKRKIINWLIIA